MNEAIMCTLIHDAIRILYLQPVHICDNLPASEQDLNVQLAIRGAQELAGKATSFL